MRSKEEREKSIILLIHTSDSKFYIPKLTVGKMGKKKVYIPRCGGFFKALIGKIATRRGEGMFYTS